MAAMKYENHFRQLKLNIEKCATLHFEFWNHLLEETPDLTRLHDQGSKINSYISAIETTWEKTQRLNPNAPIALKLYASFIIEVLNDKDSGNELLMKAKDAALVKATFD